MPTLNRHCPHPTESETFNNLPDQPSIKPSMSAGDKLRMAMIAGVPVALLVIGLGARIYYLHVSTGVAGLGGCVFGCACCSVLSFTQAQTHIAWNRGSYDKAAVPHSRRHLSFCCLPRLQAHTPSRPAALFRIRKFTAPSCLPPIIMCMPLHTHALSCCCSFP